jgi:hypothetical protein
MLRAQFTGNVTFGYSHSSNVEGRSDTVSPDGVIQPLIHLEYEKEISPPSKLQFTGEFQPYYYQKVAARTYKYAYFDATGSFYLSDIEHKNDTTTPKPEVTTKQHNDTISLSTANKESSGENHKDSTAAKVNTTHKADSNKIYAKSLMATFNAFGDELYAESEKASDKKIVALLADSLGESFYALAEVLGEEGYTVTMQEEMLEEIADYQSALLLLSKKNTGMTKLKERLDAIVADIRAHKPTKDELIPKATSESVTRLNNEVKGKQDTVSEEGDEEEEEAIAEALEEEDSPMLTLTSVEDGAVDDFTYTNATLREDVSPLTPKTLATLLSTPALFEWQSNSDTYKNYGYYMLTLSPKIELYPSAKSGVAFSYVFADTKYPQDSIYTYYENRGWASFKTEVTNDILFLSTLGLGLRQYPTPLKVSDTLAGPRKRVIEFSSQSRFLRYSASTGISGLIGDKINAGALFKLTYGPNLDSPAYIYTFNQGVKFAGKLADDEYSYNKTGGVIFANARLPEDIDVGISFDYEKRQYAELILVTYAPLTHRPNFKSFDRKDKLNITEIQITRPFVAEDKYLRLFTGITPTLVMTYTDQNSTIPSFAYKDFTFELTLAADF